MRLLKTTLADQAARAIRREIAQGGWGSSLPAEKALCARFGISRTTLRRALAILRQEGLVETLNGIGTRVVHATERHEPLLARTVGLLEPEAVDEWKPYQLLWIDELKSLLIRAGYELVIHAARHPRALEGLTRRHPHACWILSRCDPAVGQWFERRKLRCLVAGIGEGVALPGVALDNAALGRHAAGRFLAAGHRHLAVLAEKEATAAWDRCLDGFRETLESRGARLRVVRHGPKPESTFRLLGGLLRSGDRPTGLFVLNPFHYLTVLSFLAQERLSVPGDLSLITTYGSPFLHFVVPRPCCYDYRPGPYAQAVCRTVLTLVGAKTGPVPARRFLIPAFRPGASLGEVKKGAQTPRSGV